MMFLDQFGPFLWSKGGALMGPVNPILSPRNLSYNHLMKTEGWITDVTAVGSPNKSRKVNFFGDFYRFWQIRAAFEVREPF